MTEPESVVMQMTEAQALDTCAMLVEQADDVALLRFLDRYLGEHRSTQKLYLIGFRAARRLGQPVQACNWLRSAWRIGPRPDMLGATFVNMLLESDLVDEAADVIASVATRPGAASSAGLLAAHARVLTAKNLDVEALPLWLDAHRSDPEDEAIANGTFKALLAAQRYAEAEPLLEEFLKTHRKLPNFHVYAAEVAVNLGNPIAAISQVEAARAYREVQPWFWTWMISISLVCGDFDLARDLLHDVTRSDQDLTGPLSRRGLDPAFWRVPGGQSRSSVAAENND